VTVVPPFEQSNVCVVAAASCTVPLTPQGFALMAVTVGVLVVGVEDVGVDVDEDVGALALELQALTTVAMHTANAAGRRARRRLGAMDVLHAIGAEVHGFRRSRWLPLHTARRGVDVLLLLYDPWPI
jgi:hypothetical protein